MPNSTPISITKNVWIDANKRRIPIRQLDDDHLINIIRMLHRRAPEYHTHALAQLSLVEGMLQGEMAQFYAEREVRDLERTTPMVFLLRNESRFLPLIREAKRRRLTAKIADVLRDVEEAQAELKWG